MRRVKCDETKPICLRCHRLELECHYNRPKLPKRNPVPIKPADSTARTHPVPLVSAPTTVPIYQRRPIPHQQRSYLFADNQEYSYFRLFHERTSRTLSVFKSSLWNRVILQACESEPSIRHAVIALGALDLTNSTTNHKHHEFALRQYSKAIKHMQESLSQGNRDLRSAIILCLLTICFESWNGNIQSAVAQVRIGLKLIQEWQTKQPTVDYANRELLLAFYRLDNDSIMFINELPIPMSFSSYEPITYNFDTLEEAQMYFEMLLREFTHWIAQVYAWGSLQKEPQYRAPGSKPLPEYSFAAQRQTYLSDLRRWYERFQILLAERPESHPEYSAAIALQLRFQSIYVCLAADHFQGEISYDAHILQFGEIISLAERLIACEKKRTPQYSFDGSLIVSVYVTGMKCRDSAVRRSVIRILRSKPMREGTLDGALRARLVELQREIEEAGAVGNYIPEEARIRGIKTKCNMELRKGTMTYLKMAEGEKNVFKPHSIDFKW
jgi:hypothetical protein